MEHFNSGNEQPLTPPDTLNQPQKPETILGKLKSGEVVVDRPDSHLHEGVGEYLPEALGKIDSGDRWFIRACVDLNREVGFSVCVGTTEEDEIVYAKRPNRFGRTRFVKNKKPEPTSSVVAVLKKKGPSTYTLITSYIGTAAPREPWDRSMTEDPIAQKESRDFWSHHALIWGGELIIPGTESNTPDTPEENKVEDKNILYTALFIPDKEVLLSRFSPRHSKVHAHHSTIEFKPSSLNGVQLGTKHMIKIIGRAFDDKGDALLVENPLSKNEFPHITLSCVPGISPVYSNDLLRKAHTEGTLEYFNEPIEVEMVEGYSDGQNTYFGAEENL
jgi:hypothetical protein